MKKQPEVYVADFENNVPKTDIYKYNGEVDETKETICLKNFYNKYEFKGFLEREEESETRVWAAAICKVMENPGEKDVTIVPTIEEFIRECYKMPYNSRVYFHNLAYDGMLLITAVISMGYTLSKNGTPLDDDEKDELRKSGKTEEEIEEISDKRQWKKNPNPGEFMTLITGDGVWYSLRICWKHGRNVIEFRDSLKLLPFSVDKIAKDLKTKAQKLKGSIDYTIHRSYGHVLTPDEKKYIANDVLVMSEALYKIKPYHLLDSLTIASSCMKFFRTHGYEMPISEGNKKFREIFPVIDIETDAEIRKAYRGGWCYVHRPNEILKNVNGQVYDVTSLYPSVMYNHVYPVGEPHHFTPTEFDKYKRRPYYIKIRCSFVIKDNHLPFIQIKNSRWRDNEYITDSGEEPVELVLARPDFELMLEQYDINYEIIEGWWFYGKNNIFDDYIDYWFKIKDEAAKQGNMVMKLVAKLHLNSLYGKFSMNPIRTSGTPVLDDSGKIKIKSSPVIGDGGYIPLGAYVTAYARGVTVRAAQKNYKTFCYSDTDSIHLTDYAVGIDIGNSLGKWNNETSFNKARFVRQKTYIEHVIAKEGKKVEPYMNIKACGAPDAVKTRLQYKVTEMDENNQPIFYKLETDDDGKITSESRTVDEIIDRFTFGLVEAGKMTKKRVKGGSIIVETTFRIL